MSWFLAGAAALTVGSTVVNGISQKNSSIKQLNSVSKAEGDAISAERLNTTLRNAYNTALGEAQLATQKKQLSQQSSDISAAALLAHGNADLSVASTGSMGASTEAVAADIDMKSQQALDTTTDAFEQSVGNFNDSLELMVLNTSASSQTVRQPEYTGPSSGAILGTAVLGGLTQFAMGYASRQMTLGKGK